MDILGLHPIPIALGIVIIGIVLRTIIGVLGKTKADFNINQVVLSFILGFFASIQLVIVAVENIHPDADELIQLSFVTGQIAAVMGIDAGIKSGGKAIMRKTQNTVAAKVFGIQPQDDNDPNELIQDIPPTPPPGKEI